MQAGRNNPPSPYDREDSRREQSIEDVTDQGCE
jgi:hypothetical protein